MIGKTISHYKILEKLGEGGMGVVYKAEDIKLHRPVAIKFLPKRLSIYGEERERFFHEAYAASALNHPNICVIHEIDEVNEDTFLVMEYVEGITLRDWTRKQLEKTEGYRKLGVKEAVSMAIQMAEGLEKAHEKGIIHRDVKAENIMVTEDGRVKIMDFGLAKLRGVSKLTKTGSTVGTIAYMSPEQVEGIETDHRTDIFSFGVALYEMLAGKLPFQAEHEAALMYEIINVEPASLLGLRKSVDGELNRIVMKCLEKNREERYQSMREIVVDLKRYKRDTEGKKIERTITRVAVREPFLRKYKKLSMAGGILILLLIFIGIWLYLKPGGIKQTKGPEPKLTKVTFDPGLEDEPTWSPDGKFLAYTTDEKGNLDIVVVPIGGGQPIRVVESEADEAQPAWSPDGSMLAFVSAREHGGRLSIVLGQGPIQPFISGGKGGDIFLVPALGGRPVKLAENGYYPAWSPDGRKIVFQSNRGGQWDLWTIPAEGGIPIQLTNDENFDYQASWSPDGKWIVYGSGLVTVYNARVIPAEGGNPIQVTNENYWIIRPIWSSDGKNILFSSARGGSMNLWKIRFPPSDNQKLDLPTQVTIGEGNDVNVSLDKIGKKIAFATVRNTSDIWELTIFSGKLRQVSFETSAEDYPQLSPDGKTVLVESDRGAKLALWTMDLNGKVLSQLTSGEKVDRSARWSPDGKKIAYFQEGARGEGKIFTQNLGDVASREIIDGAFPTWSPDGNKLAFSHIKNSKEDVWVYSFEKGEAKQITFLESLNNGYPAWSPDGKYITFNAEKGSVRQIWIIPSEGGTPKQITKGESEYSHPQWSPVDKDQIMFLKDHRNVCIISLSTGKITQLTNFVESNVTLDFPSWSFDGGKIYFTLRKKVGDIYVLENY